MVSQPPLCLDQGISDMHPGDHREGTREPDPGRPAEVAAEGAPSSEPLFLGAIIAHRTPTHQKQGETKILCHCAIALKDYNQMKFGKLLGRVEVVFSSKEGRRLNVYKVV